MLDSDHLVFADIEDLRDGPFTPFSDGETGPAKAALWSVRGIESLFWG
jgi:hypothetical protein